MYASLGIYILIPGKREELVQYVEANKDKAKDAKGFKKAVYFSDEARNEYGLLTVWETKEQCDEFIESNKLARQRGSTPTVMAGTLFENRCFYVNYVVE